MQKTRPTLIVEEITHGPEAGFEVDGRQIRHLFEDDRLDDRVILVGGNGRQFQADAGEWDAVKHLSEYE
jgi:hypothetical protein